jgi:hypothetical protein
MPYNNCQDDNWLASMMINQLNCQWCHRCAGWIYQDTYACLHSLEPVLAAAFEEAGIRRQMPALPFSETYMMPADTTVEQSKEAPAPSTEHAAEAAAGRIAERAAEQPHHFKKAKRRPRVSTAVEQAKPAAEVEDRWTGIVCTGDGC